MAKDHDGLGRGAVSICRVPSHRAVRSGSEVATLDQRPVLRRQPDDGARHPPGPCCRQHGRSRCRHSRRRCRPQSARSACRRRAGPDLTVRILRGNEPGRLMWSFESPLASVDDRKASRRSATTPGRLHGRSSPRSPTRGHRSVEARVKGIGLTIASEGSRRDVDRAVER